MSYAAKQLARVLIISSLAAFLVLGGVWNNPTTATDSRVGLIVCGAESALLSITAPLAGSVVNVPEVTITGEVQRISQYKVYLDGDLVEIISLDIGSTSFSYTTTIAKGSHTIRFVGIDPCTQSTPEASVTLTYNPAVDPTPQPTPNGKLPRPIQTAVDHAQRTGGDVVEYMQGQVEEASQSPSGSSLSDVIYKALVAVDIAPPAASSQEVNKMMTRVGLVAAGMAMVTMASPLVVAYHSLRYQVLKWNIHAMPELVRHHAVLTLRIIGAALAFAPFLLLR